MKSGLTEIVCILDKSGSMNSLRSDTIGGFNSFIDQQKKLPGDAYVTLALFNGSYEIAHDHIKLVDLPELDESTYIPDGYTALFDAVGRTITNIGERLSATDESERPEKVIVTIITDGHENASSDYTKTRIKEMIEHQTSVYSWEFLFLGANIDAATEAESIGISRTKSVTFGANSADTQKMFRAVSCSYSSLRSCKDNTLYDTMNLADVYDNA